MEGKNLCALILGATGAVGRETLKQLISHPAFTSVRVVARRPLTDITSDKIDFKQIDFDNLKEHEAVFEGVQVAYCCLGTTRGKSGKEGFVKVDRDYVVNCATILKAKDCQHFHLVTSQGSDKKSMFLYTKTKGEAEEAVSELQFPRLSIYQPGLLICDREETRILETFGQSMAKAFDWRNRISVHVETVARSMITNTLCAPSCEHQPQQTDTPLVEKVVHADILRLGTD